MKIPEVYKGWVDDIEDHVFKGEGFFRGVPESGMEDSRVDIFHNDIYDEEGEGPEQVRDDQAMKAGL